MTNLERLKEALNNDENFKRFKELEAIIDKDEHLNYEFKYLQDLQKLMVQDEANNSKSTISKKNYNDQLEVVLGHYLMSEYLDLLEVVNNDLQLIKSIITKEINMEIE